MNVSKDRDCVIDTLSLSQVAMCPSRGNKSDSHSVKAFSSRAVRHLPRKSDKVDKKVRKIKIKIKGRKFRGR